MAEDDTHQIDRDRQLRLRVVMVIAPGVVGLLLLLLGQQRFILPIGNGQYLPVSIIATLLGMVLLLLTALIIAMTYLQTGFKSQLAEDGSRPRSMEYRMQSRAPDGRAVSHYRTFDVDGLQSDLSALKDKVAHLETATTGNTDEQIGAIADQLTTRVLDAGGEELLRRADDRLRAEIEKIRTFHTINETFEGSKERLRSEISRLDWKSNFNLSLGGVIAVVGIGLLGYAVLFHQQNAVSIESFAMALAPRLSVVILLEILAFFFLRLYKANLGEVKYFQNEITNVEHRQIAINAAMERGGDDQWKDLLMVLAKTERNRILEKGQTTIDIEQARLENDTGTAEILAKLIPLLKK